MIVGVSILLSIYIDALYVNIAGVNATNLAHAYYVVTPHPLAQASPMHIT